MSARWLGSFAMCVAVLAFAVPARAQAMRIVETVAATSDAHDVVVFGDRTLVATSGGVVVLREGVRERTLGVRDGLPGLRMRSLSVVIDSVWVGGIDGAARIERDAAGTVRVAETVPLARVQRVVVDRGATFFATAGGGLFRRDEGATRLVPITLGHSPAFMHVTDLVADGDTLWAATVGAGLVGIDARGRASRRINAQRGLASDLVWRLVRDGDRILVATAAGLSEIRNGRIDAHAAEANATGTLPIPDVRAITRTTGGLVVATYGGGLARFDGRAGRYISIAGSPSNARAITTNGAHGDLLVAHPSGLSRIAANNAVTSVVEGGLPSSDVTALAHAFGTLWIGTFDHGLARRDDDGSVRAVLDATSRWHIDGRVNDLAHTHDDTHGERLWIATDRGLFVHDGRSFVPVVDRDGPGIHHVTALHVDATGTLWVAASEGLFSMRASDGHWTHVEPADDYGMRPLGAVTTDARGTVWAGGLHGLFEIDAASGHVTRHAVATDELPVDWVTAIARTNDGIVAGTYHGGLVRIADGQVAIEREGRGALPSGWVNPHALAVVDDVAWFGTLDRGLVVGTPSHWRTIRIADGLPGNDVTAIDRAEDGSFWIGTRAGLVRIERH